MSGAIERKRLPKVLAGMSRKLRAYVHVIPGGMPIELHGTCWDEGSKSEYTLVNLATGERRRCAGASNLWVKPPVVTVEPGWVLVCGGITQGKPSCLSIRVAVAALDAATPVGIIADWLSEHGREPEANLLRSAS